MYLFFLGYNGYIGNKILKILETRPIKKNLKIIKINHPPYDLKIKGLKKNDKVIIFKSIYSRNLIKYIKTCFSLLPLKNKTDNLYIIEICSLLQLANLKSIFLFPRYTLYFINRKMQSFICYIFFSYLSNLDIYQIYFGKTTEDNLKKSTCTISIEFLYHNLEKLIINIIRDDTDFFNNKKLILNSSFPVLKENGIQRELDLISTRQFKRKVKKET